MRKIVIYPILYCLTHVCVYASDDGNPEVQIEQGVLRGKHWFSRNGRRFGAFLGIPFATPPVGELRFRAPIPAGSWKGVLDATKDHTVCPQRNFYTREIIGDENCLYLNVYTPKWHQYNSHPLPVMLYFHGGGFFCEDSTSSSYGPDILLDKDVVLVTTNYRLGALGFLTTGDEVVPGNNGMKDQNLALKWVKKNIKNFGGNSNSITIFGESAGGVSVQLHMLSPLSQGLFHRAISQSGTAYAIWAVASKNEGLFISKKLATLLNCSITTSEVMVDCLRKFEPTSLIETDQYFLEWDVDPIIIFKPVIEPDLEGAFIVEHPEDLIQSGKYADVPWITGINTDEGGLRVAGFYANAHLLNDINNEFNRIMPFSLLYGTVVSNKDLVSKHIREFYFEKKRIDNSTKTQLINMYTDSWTLSGTDTAVRLHLKYSKQPVYYYLFGHRGLVSYSEVFGDASNNYGVCHGDELQYLFPVGDVLFPDKQPNAADRQISEIMTTLWTNFAKTGNPTPEISLPITKKWEPVQNSMEYYFIENEINIRMEQGLFLERADFWRKLLDAHQKKSGHEEL